MKLTPLDIRKHEFTSKLRGFDPEEVVAFNEMVSRQWEEMLDELRHTKDRVRELEGKIEHYEKVESALHEALQSARSGAKRTQEQAEERARLIVEEAELKAEQLLQEADQRQHRLRHDIKDLTHRHSEITARLRHFLMSELEILARHEEHSPIGFMQLVPSKPAAPLPSVPRDEADKSMPAEPMSAPSTDDKGEKESTYGDLYTRAAEAESARAVEDDASEIEEEEADEVEEPGWTLRSIVSGADDESDNESEGTADRETGTAPDAEKERIRRILEDLD